IEYCQDRNSSTVSVYRLHASSSDSNPPRTAATTSALRRITQRLVPGAGKSAIVSGEPSGPMTYLTLGRWGSVISTLTNSTTHCGRPYAGPLKICLSGRRVWRHLQAFTRWTGLAAGPQPRRGPKSVTRAVG